MSGKQGRAFWELDIYRRYEELSEMLWNASESWDLRRYGRLRDQMLDAVDSIGGNIAEAVGRWYPKEGTHFLTYARGSLTETQHWIRVGIRRKLFSDDLIPRLREVSTTLLRQLNAFIRSQRLACWGAAAGQNAASVQESEAAYGDFAACSTDRRPPRRRSVANSQKPIANSQKPIAKSQEPVANTQKRIASSQKPIAKSQKPIAGGAHG